MENKICCIFGAGDYFGGETVPAGAFVVAADGGLAVCRQNEINPAVIIGDFDSLGYEVQGDNVILLPKIKDDTDTLAAVKYALEKGYRIFLLFGCTGGRLSHTLANLQTLTYIAKRGGIGFLIDKEEVTTATCKGLDFDSQVSGFLSIFAAEGSTTVTLSGLQYEAQSLTLTSDFPLGVSNTFIGKKARVAVEKGCAHILFETQNLENIIKEQTK
ncbi:MAG: thiamine diphosphokinase [Clostridia bacterium]|nr:thiamine diphosphokinase [Clostridia bacterium]